jgi:hypothetical protein
MGAEQEYEFVLIVDGVSTEDDEAVAILTDAFDGVLSWNRGLYRLAVSGTGRDSYEAASRLVSRLTGALPGLKISADRPLSAERPAMGERRAERQPAVPGTGRVCGTFSRLALGGRQRMAQAAGRQRRGAPAIARGSCPH